MRTENVIENISLLSKFKFLLSLILLIESSLAYFVNAYYTGIHLIKKLNWNHKIMNNIGICEAVYKSKKKMTWEYLPGEKR